MDKKEQFFTILEKEMGVTLATADSASVTMRVVSPVPYHGAVLIFTNPSSRKYMQLKANPHCCISAGPFFAECRAELLGPTMLPENAALREVYSAKFPGAFDSGVTFGGIVADFILLTPERLSGWGFENDIPTPDGIPNSPFSIDLT